MTFYQKIALCLIVICPLLLLGMQYAYGDDDLYSDDLPWLSGYRIDKSGDYWIDYNNHPGFSWINVIFKSHIGRELYNGEEYELILDNVALPHYYSSTSDEVWAAIARDMPQYAEEEAAYKAKLEADKTRQEAPMETSKTSTPVQTQTPSRSESASTPAQPASTYQNSTTSNNSRYNPQASPQQEGGTSPTPSAPQESAPLDKDNAMPGQENSTPSETPQVIYPIENADSSQKDDMTTTFLPYEEASSGVEIQGIESSIIDNVIVRTGLVTLPILLLMLIGGIFVSHMDDYEPKTRLMKRIMSWFRRRRKNSSGQIFDERPYSANPLPPYNPYNPSLSNAKNSERHR